MTASAAQSHEFNRQISRFRIAAKPTQIASGTRLIAASLSKRRRTAMVPITASHCGMISIKPSKVLWAAKNNHDHARLRKSCIRKNVASQCAFEGRRSTPYAPRSKRHQYVKNRPDGPKNRVGRREPRLSQQVIPLRDIRRGPGGTDHNRCRSGQTRNADNDVSSSNLYRLSGFRHDFTHALPLLLAR